MREEFGQGLFPGVLSLVIAAEWTCWTEGHRPPSHHLIACVCVREGQSVCVGGGGGGERKIVCYICVQVSVRVYMCVNFIFLPLTILLQSHPHPIRTT